MIEHPIGYSGIENEFQLKRYGATINEESSFTDALKAYKKPVFKKSDTAIRTLSGGGIYLDGSEPEVCSSPSRIRKGCITEIANNLYSIRKDLLEIVSVDPSLRLIGYSSHWNMGEVIYSEGITRAEVMKHMVIPYSLFTLNPLSSGINLRYKQDGGRWELLGDYVEDLDQVKAFMLLYMGSIIGMRGNGRNLPFSVDEESNDGGAKYDNLVLDGRYTDVDIKINDHTRTIKAQTYLEIYYSVFKDSIRELGTPEEVKNLEEFIRGDKPLEIDRFRKYAMANNFKSGLGFKLNPLIEVNPQNYSSTRNPDGALAMFLSTLAQNEFATNKIISGHPIWSAKTLDWEKVDLQTPSAEYHLDSLSHMDFFAEVLHRVSEENKYEALRNLAMLQRGGFSKMFSDLKRFSDNPDDVITDPHRMFLCDLLQKTKVIGDNYEITPFGNELISTVRAYDAERLPKTGIGKINVKTAISELESKTLEYDPQKDQEWDGQYLNGLKESIIKSKKKFDIKSIWVNREHVDKKRLINYTLIGLTAGLLIGMLGELFTSILYDPKYQHTDVTNTAIHDTTKNIQHTNSLKNYIEGKKTSETHKGTYKQ